MLPWACDGVGLGEDVLELGPGYGVTTRWLASHGGRLSAVEIDPILAAGLRRGLGQPVEVHTGSGTDLPFADAAFDTVVCFTMLHHLPSPEQQDQLFAEAARVLRPGGVFAGSDSTLSVPFRLLHLGDTMTVVDPHTLPARLQAAGLTDVQMDVRPLPALQRPPTGTGCLITRRRSTLGRLVGGTSTGTTESRPTTV